MTLVKVFFLVGLLFNSAGTVQQSGTVGAFRTLDECNVARVEVIQAPPPGLAPNTGLVCVEVEVPVTQTRS